MHFVNKSSVLYFHGYSPSPSLLIFCNYTSNICVYPIKKFQEFVRLCHDKLGNPSFTDPTTMEEYLDAEELKIVCKIHGYVSSEEDSSNDESPKQADIYERCKPGPIEIDPKKHTVIEIGDLEGASNLTYAEVLKKNIEIEPQGNCEKLSKGQKRRRKKKQRKESERVALLVKITEDEKQNQKLEGFSELNADKVETSSVQDLLQEDQEIVDEKSKNQKKKRRKKQKRAARDKPNSGVVGDCQDEIEKSGPLIKVLETKSHKKPPPISNNATFMAIEELNTQLTNYIAHNTCNGFGILVQIQRYLQSLIKLGIPLLHCTHCIATIIKKLAFLYENYVRCMTVKLVFPADNQHFFFITETIIYETVTQGNYNSDFHFTQVPVQKFIYENLNTILITYLKSVVVTIYTITGVDCWDYITPWTMFQNNGVLHLGHLANFIHQKRSTGWPTAPVTVSPTITELTSVCPTEKLEESQTQSQLSVTDDLMSNGTRFKVNNLKPIGPTTNLMGLQNQESQTQLRLSVIDDLSSNGTLYESRSSFKSYSNPTELSIQSRIQPLITNENNLSHIGANYESRRNLVSQCKKNNPSQWLRVGSVLCLTGVALWALRKKL